MRGIIHGKGTEKMKMGNGFDRGLISGAYRE